MKKILIPVLGSLFLLTACKKDYTCDCKVTSIETGGNDPDSYSDEYSVTYFDTKKSYVKSHMDCISREENYTYESFVGYEPGTMTPVYATVSVKDTYECELQK